MFNLQTDRSLFVTILVGFIVAFGLIFIVLSVQQLNNTNTTFSTQEASAAPVALGFCPDNVQGGVEAQISMGGKDNYSAGENIPLSVTVSNPFSYDITGAELLLAIVYTPQNFVVDYTTHSETLTIPAQDSITVNVPMEVSAAVSTGGHEVVAYVGQSGQEILLSNALVGVEGQGSASLFLYGNDDPVEGEIIRIMNGGGVLVAGESVADEMVRKVPGDSEQATVRLTIQNTYETTVPGTLTWKVYSGLTPHPSLLMDTITEQLSFDPSAPSLIETLDIDLEFDQYSVVAELTYEDSRQLAYIPFEKEGTNVSRAIPPFLQLTHFGLNESGTLVGCMGTRSVTDPTVETGSEHAPFPYEVELALYADEQSMVNGGSPVTVLEAADTATNLYQNDLGFSSQTNRSQSEYYVETTISQLGGEVSSDQFVLSCNGTGCQQTSATKSSMGSGLTSIQFAAAVASFVLFLFILIWLFSSLNIYTIYGGRKPEDQE